ncbi:MAG: ATP-binding protein [Gemmatimonadetes bacterium]|nr:ATP-binding protein [Gemmatimonadota bacterium]
MGEERWFPIRHQLLDGSRLGRLLHGGPEWQIYRVDQDNSLLVVRSALAERWVDLRLVPDTVLEPFPFGRMDFKAIPSGVRQRLEPVVGSSGPDSKADGLSFAVSLSETRKIEAEAPLHDAIYAERYSRLLPTWTVSVGTTDEVVLGRWLTGGVSVSATSFRRLTSLLGWLDKEDIRELLEAAGLPGPQESGRALTRHRPQSQTPKPGLEDADENVLCPVVIGNSRSSPKTRQFQLAGRPSLERFFNEYVIDIIQNAERYKALGIGFPTAIVLHGPPGCGKTFAVERLVEYLDWPIFHIDSDSVGSPYIHETSRRVGEVFDKATEAAPSMIVIDEMESYLSDRQINESGGLHHVEEVAEFLRRIPEANKRHVLVIGMTNRIEMIDSAILRRGRFDHIVEVGMPSAAEISDLVSSILENLPVHGVIDTNQVVEALAGRALSDVAFVAREAARLSARAGKDALDNDSLKSALTSLPPAEPEKRPIGFRQD